VITAVDTSVLIAITKDDPSARQWIVVLAEAQAMGDLVICDVVAAEFFAAVLDRRKFGQALAALGVVFSPMSLESAQLAGRIFKAYRREGGPREHLLPDFLIGAHARTQADQLAAVNRGYLRRYFPQLRLLRPR
jgi:predicted nucleic acid-binding protein